LSNKLPLLFVLLAFLATVAVGMWWVMPVIFLAFMLVAVVIGLIHTYLNRKTVNIYLFTENKKYVDDDVFDKNHERMLH